MQNASLQRLAVCQKSSESLLIGLMYNINVDLDELLSHDVASPEKVLNKYTFKRFAKIMHDTLCGFS